MVWIVFGVFMIIAAYLIGRMDGYAGRRPNCPACAAWAREVAYIGDKEDAAGRATALLRTGVDPGVTASPETHATGRRALETAERY
jgi:hypothetical protein